MRTTSPAALLTNKSTSSRPPAIRRHSLKKCPEPVSAQPQRGVLRLTIGLFFIGRRSLERNAHAGAVTDRDDGRAMVGRSQNRDRKRHHLEKSSKLLIHDFRRDQIPELSGAKGQFRVFYDPQPAGPDLCCQPSRQTV